MNEFEREHLLNQTRIEGRNAEQRAKVDELSRDNPSLLVEMALLENADQGEQAARSVVMKALAELAHDHKKVSVRASRRPWISAAAAVVLLLTGTAAGWAAIQLGSRLLSGPASPPRSASVDHPERSHEELSRSPKREADPGQPLAPDASEDLSRPEASPEPALIEEGTQSRGVASAEAASRERAARWSRRSETAGLGAPSKSDGRSKVDSTTLLAQADQQRRVGAPEQAIRLYRKLQLAFPTSPEATVSRVSLGQLLLARNRPEEALRAFRTYLSTDPGGPLVQAALVGTARALERLQRGVEEKKVWERLLRNFPDTLHRRRAEARLRELR